jgi:hypothetical protein
MRNAKRVQPTEAGHAFGFPPRCRQALFLRRYSPGRRGATLIGRPTRTSSKHRIPAMHGVDLMREIQAWSPVVFDNWPCLVNPISRSWTSFRGYLMFGIQCRQVRFFACLNVFGAVVAFNRRGATTPWQLPDVFAKQGYLALVMAWLCLARKGETVGQMDVVEERRGFAGHQSYPVHCHRIIRQPHENTKQWLIRKTLRLLTLNAVQTFFEESRLAGAVAGLPNPVRYTLR